MQLKKFDKLIFKVSKQRNLYVTMIRCYILAKDQNSGSKSNKRTKNW